MGKIFHRAVHYLWAVAAVIGVVLILVSFLKKPADFAGNSNPERILFLEQNGWQVEEEPVFIFSVRIPSDFDDVYRNYNQIQLEQGFDLSSYKGKEVERYQYKVMNYPNFTGEVRANLLVFHGKIVGGDICSLTLDGFMHGILQKSGEKQRK